MSTDLCISPATPDQIPQAHAIFLNVIQWLNTLGQPLWTPAQVAPDLLLKYVQTGELHLAHLNQTPIGAFLLQYQDPFAWPDVPAGQSAFIHKLAVIRSHAKSGIALSMLDWSRQKAASQGKRFLRLDCAPRPRLCAFYEKAGFTRHSERQAGPYTLVRYQMELIPNS
jgi:GNAT superfamily N-acetyltransferase